MSHQTGMSGGPQTETGSNSVPVLGMRLTSKCLAATHSVPAHFSGGAGPQGVVRARPKELIRPKQTKI